jgi:hypothetical protein
VSGIRRFLDFIGNMGLMARADPPKVVDLTGREWGLPVAGLSLSARQVRKQDSDELPTISVVLRNEGPATLTFTAPGWLAFYELNVSGLDGAEVPLSGYGSQLLKASRGTEKVEVSLAPGAATETLLPVGTLYSMRGRGDYKVQVSCRLPDGSVLASNEAVVTP